MKYRNGKLTSYGLPNAGTSIATLKTVLFIYKMDC